MLDQLPAGVGWLVIDTDDLRLAGAPGHAFEAFESVPARELDGHDLISFREGAGLRAAADKVLRAADATPNIIVESNEMPVLVGHGLGLAILPVAFIEQSRYPIWSRPLDPPIRPSLINCRRVVADTGWCVPTPVPPGPPPRSQRCHDTRAPRRE